MLRLDADRLRGAFGRILDELHVARPSGQDVVASLLQTSLRGVDSHGIELFPHYVRAVRAGRINAQPKLEFEQTGLSTAALEADHAFGHHAGALAIDRAIDIAEQSGVGAVSVRNSTHFGAAAYFALRAAERGHLGFAFTNADALMKPPGGRGAFLGTNPVCFTAPLLREGPLCLDMATSLVSWNKVKGRRISGEALGADWAFDSDGAPTIDAVAARTLNPAGGYKGQGLSIMVEILCGALAGGPMATEILPMFAAPIESKRHISHFFVAMDVARFVDREVFRERLQGLVDALRAMPPLDGRVLAPGDPEKAALEDRSRDGIPISDAQFAALLDVGVEIRDAVLR